MSAKPHYDYEVKQKARDLQKDFIRKHYPRSGERKDLNVVCFPGSEGLEITRLYDELDIKRRNIVGIECDLTAYKKIESLGLGIELFRGYDKDFFSATDRKFDIISLDYQGYIDPEKSEVIRRVAKNNINNVSIIHTNFQGKRENENSKGMYFRANKISAIVDSVAKTKSDEDTIKKFEEYRKIDETELSDLRSKALTQQLFGDITRRERNSTEYHKVLYQFPTAYQEMRSLADKMNKTGKYNYEDLDEYTDLVMSQFFMPHFFQNSEIYQEITGIPHELLRLAYKIDGSDNITQILDHDSYKYISDDGTPMYGDVMRVRNLKTELTKRLGIKFQFSEMPVYPWPIITSMVSLETGPLVAKLPQFTETISHLVPVMHFEGKPITTKKEADVVMRRVGREALEIIKGIDGLTKDTERKFLGSSFKPRATNDDIRESLLNGTFDQLMQTHRVDESSVPAIKAHITIGTYAEEKVPIQKAENNSKIQAIELLKSGKSPEEVSHILGLTKQQAAAYKAWITMGKY